MAQSIEHYRYPKFVADQVLTEKSLNQMFGYLEEQQRLTRTTLIGIGVMCGMQVTVNDTQTQLTISHGVGVTSKGYLIPFPETTYSLYDDTFSAEEEIIYDLFVDDVTKTQKFPLYRMHNDFAADVQKPLSSSFLEDKVVVIFVELLKVDNQNCDPDSCDDKGCTIEITHRPLLVAQEHIDQLIFGDNELPFLNEPSCIEWPALKMPKYNVPATLLLSSNAVLKNFLDILTSDFIFEIETVLGAAYDSFGYYIEDEFPSNPFSGLRNSFAFLFNGTISAEQLLHVQYYYDFFSDLILAYEELRSLCNECLAICCPNEALFPRHLILGNAISTAEEFKHHWIASPAFSCGGCSEGRVKFHLKKMVLLLQKLSIPRTTAFAGARQEMIKITPSSYGNLPLSEKAIPFYYDIVNAPDELYNHWNYKKTKLKKGNTNLSFDAEQYNSAPFVSSPLNYDLEPFNFLRVEGHVGMNWKSALSEIQKIKREKRLPIDVVALNGDIFALIQSLLTSANSLFDIMSGNKEIIGELRCYFADIESQYDAHAAELRCTITKVMAFFYNFPVFGQEGGMVQTTNIPESALVRKGFPAYRTKTNTYGAIFDATYPQQRNMPYISYEALVSMNGFKNPDGSINEKAIGGIPYALMYYMEKIHEALPDGLVQLQLNTITQRLNDAAQLAILTTLAFDLAKIDLPASLEGTLDAIVRICKGEVFKVLYRNFLINYVLFMANQTFALYAFKNPGIQHKAGVTVGGTLILVYNDKAEIRDLNRRITGKVVSVTGAPITGASIVEKGTTTGTQSDFDGNFNISTKGPNPILVASFVGYITQEVPVASNNTLTIIMTPEGRTGGSRAFAAAEEAREKPLDNYMASSTNAKAENPFMNLRNSGNESVKAAGLNDVFEIIDGADKEGGIDQDISTLINQFQEGTVIADFFVPNMCKASCMAMNYMVVNAEDLPDTPTPVPPTETTTFELPSMNLRWGLKRRSFNSLVAYNSDNAIGSSTPPDEVDINGQVHLMEVNLLGSDREWLKYSPKLHLLRYKPKKRLSEPTKAGFRKEAAITLDYYQRVNEFTITDSTTDIDIKPDRYFTARKSNGRIQPMGLSSPNHNMYFYLVLSINKDGETIYGEPSKIFKITINEGNLLSFHIS